MTPIEYIHKTKPFEHQAALFKDTARANAYGLFWEQGCGKTKPTIDTAALLFEDGEIDALLVVAPNGVHRNWITDELPLHMPDRVAARMRSAYLETDKLGTTPTGIKRAGQVAMDALMTHKGLSVLTVSYDSFITPKGKDFLGKFMRARKVMMVVDESQGIKNPVAIRTKTLMAASKFARYRRILTGTPISQGPFDVYSQIKFLDPTFWTRHGFPDFYCFKTYFGIFTKKPFGPGGKMVDMLVGYRNLDELNTILKSITHRLTKKDALDLPPKIYAKRYFDMTPAQSKAYVNLKEELFTELAGGEIVEANLAIVRLLRFQQITCGYVGDVEGNLVPFEDNPRIKLLKNITDETQGAGIIWARFTEDVNQIMEMLGPEAVRYDGMVDDDGRARSKAIFQAGDAKWFVGNQAAGATGLTLVQAKTVIYYSNNFRLVDRLQSEDRAHRIGQDEPVNYIDLVCSGTVDERIVSSLRNKLDVASQITGDDLKEWI